MRAAKILAAPIRLQTACCHVVLKLWLLVLFLRRWRIVHKSEITVIKKAASDLGYAQLRDKQTKAISNFLTRNDIFVSLPTGSG